MLINTFAFIIKNKIKNFFKKVKYPDLPTKPNKRQFKKKKSVPLTYLTKIYLIRNLLGQANGYIS